MLPPGGVIHAPSVVSSLLYYTMAVNYTLLVALGNLVSTQTQVNRDTLDTLIWLLNYIAAHPTAAITYVASDSSTLV